MKQNQLLSIIISFLLWITLTTSLSAFSIDRMPDEPSSCLVLWHKDGSKVVFNLSDAPQISYHEEKVIIKASSTVEYDFQAIKKMTYEKEGADVINATDIKKNMPFINNGETITFIPADKDLRVQVVTLNGIVVKEITIKKGESSSFSMDYLSKANIYMVVVNGVTYKIKK